MKVSEHTGGPCLKTWRRFNLLLFAAFTWRGDSLCWHCIRTQRKLIWLTFRANGIFSISRWRDSLGKFFSKFMVLIFFFWFFTVRDHGFDYALDVNDGLDSNIEDNLWCMASPMAMQDELCDPISDWLSVTKETNNNDNSSSRSQIYNINDTLLSPTFTTVPKTSQYNRKDTFNTSPPLQPDTTFFHSDSMFSDRNPTLSENLFDKREHTLQLPTTNSIYTQKVSDRDTSYTFHDTQFLERKLHVPALSRVTVDTDVSSPCSVQSPSITQSNLNQEEKNRSGITTRRNVKLKLKVNEPSNSSSCSLDTPEMLQPLVNKNSEFDLVSYVFDVSICPEYAYLLKFKCSLTISNWIVESSSRIYFAKKFVPRRQKVVE